ncbi:hypothetical protein ACFXGA_06115 [Actinosynnema sp. NPDC059335]|uniref:hypothetical protein n=1 Tax=Actinosynnema sp. NPDC059335 TaxID=3346804 RepID=UPI00366DBE81
MATTKRPATKPAATATADFEVILAEPGHLTVAGIPARVKRIRTRELMLAVRVLTSGVGAGLAHIDWDDRDNLQVNLAGLLLSAIPDAYDEFVDLVRALVEPAEPIQDSDTQRAWNQEMANPEVETTVDVIAVLVAQERDVIPVLLGKARTLLKASSALFRTGKKNS